MQRWTAPEPLPIPPHDDSFAAELEFEDLRHDGPSFAAYVYFDNPEVDEGAGLEGAGYVGSFQVFGHGECWGDVGHCDLPSEPVNPFDRRPPHSLTPINVAVDCTTALRELGEKAEVTVTVLALSQDPEQKPEPLKFKRLTLVTYDY